MRKQNAPLLTKTIINLSVGESGSVNIHITIWLTRWAGKKPTRRCDWLPGALHAEVSNKKLPKTIFWPQAYIYEIGNMNRVSIELNYKSTAFCDECRSLSFPL